MLTLTRGRARVLLVGGAAVLGTVIGTSCRGVWKDVGDTIVDVAQYCREHPEECEKGTPVPPAAPTPIMISTPTPAAAPYCMNLPKGDCTPCLDETSKRGRYRLVTEPCSALPSPTLTTMPPAPTPTPTMEPNLPARFCDRMKNDCDCVVCVDRVPGGSNPRLCNWYYVECVTPTPSPTPTVMPTATPTVVPTSTPPPIRNEVCVEGNRLRSTLGDWTPPPVPVPVRKTGPCPQFTVEVGPDRNGVIGCQLTYTKAPGEQGRTPAEGAQVALANGHVVIDVDGMIRDVDNGASRGGDAYIRTVADGHIVPRPDGLGDWDGAFAWPIPCPAMPTPAPMPMPTRPTPAPTPVAGCDVVERVGHWMAPGNKAHSWHPDGDHIRAVIDSTIRSDAGICDEDHHEDWLRCGQKHHDPDYNKKSSAFIWSFTGIIQDLGPNTDDDDTTCSTRDGVFPMGSPQCTGSWENSAQRIVIADQGACVTVTVCIPPDARTPEGCRIPARYGRVCDTRTFKFPEGGKCD